MITEALRARIEAALGRRIAQISRVTGGDINQAFELELAGGHRVFLKTNDSAPPGVFAAEARGLELLRAPRALRIPEVLACSAAYERPSFLLLEFIASARPKPNFEEQLGRGLAALHRSGPASFGLSEPSFIACFEQSNRAHPTWAEFYREERLQPQLVLAERAGRASSALLRAFDRVFGRLPELVGESEAPALLHGDLWGGNLHIDEHGAPCLIDPAVYGGHREIDLAMMQLFGGFGARTFSAYTEAYPLASGHAERVQLYQLYPLLVHLNLFGGSYASAVQNALARYV